MNTEENKDLLSMDKNRLAYMVSWRDRYIKGLEARLEGREEESTILQTLLFYALVKAGRETEQGNAEIRIARSDIAALLGKWRCEATRDGEDYLITFTPAEAERTAEETCGDGTESTAEEASGDGAESVIGETCGDEEEGR